MSTKKPERPPGVEGPIVIKGNRDPIGSMPCSKGGCTGRALPTQKQGGTQSYVCNKCGTPSRGKKF